MSPANTEPQARVERLTHSEVRRSHFSAALGHELSNLLDGSMRNLGLVITSLRDGAEHRLSPTQVEEGLIAQLELANRGLGQMATVLRSWMRDIRQQGKLQGRYQTVSEVTAQTVKLFGLAASEQRIDIIVQLEDDAAGVPAQLVYPSLANALRNSIEAFADERYPQPHQRCITVIGGIDVEQLNLVIADNGPGLDPRLFDEHGQFRFGQTTKGKDRGLGLMLSLNMARSLGGDLQLRNRPEGGTELTMRFPIARLTSAVPQVIDHE